MKRILSLGALALLLLFCAGCGPGNNVRLLQKPPDSNTLPAPGAPSVTVVEFQDKRGTGSEQLGVRRDKSSFTTNMRVAEWVSRSLADELSKLGLQVSYATTVDQARSGKPGYIVTGTIDEVWLKESSAMELSATIRATMIVSGLKGRLLTEGLSASQTQKGLPGASVAENLLLDTMQELVQPAARKADQVINKK